MKKLITVATLFLSVNVFAQSEELKQYLEALKTYEFDESKKVIRSLTFIDLPKTGILDYNEINGTLFDADTLDIKGYKAMIICKIETADLGSIEKKMMAVMYFDKHISKWKIFAFREAVDLTHEYEAAKENYIKKNYNLADRHSLKRLSYWSIMSGHLSKALEFMNLANQDARIYNDKEFDLENMDTVVLSILKN